MILSLGSQSDIDEPPERRPVPFSLSLAVDNDSSLSLRRKEEAARTYSTAIRERTRTSVATKKNFACFASAAWLLVADRSIGQPAAWSFGFKSTRNVLFEPQLQY